MRKTSHDNGGRGIKVCERWKDYINFREDMGPTFVPGLSIERKNNDGDYEPDNCRWATRVEQARNRRSNRLIEFRGETVAAAELAERHGVNYALFHQRIHVLKWPIERALMQKHRGWGPHHRKAEELMR